MLDSLTLADIGSRLLNSGLRLFLLVNKYCYALSHEIWVLKLEVECNIVSSDHTEHPANLYHRLVIMSRDRGSCNIACSEGDYPAVKFLASSTPHILPTTWDANRAARNGDMKMLQYIISLGIRPDEDGANGAAEMEHMEIVQYLASLDPPVLHQPGRVALVKGLKLIAPLIGTVIPYMPEPVAPSFLPAYDE